MGEVQVLSRTQKIIVTQSPSIVLSDNGPVVHNSIVRVVNGGAVGPQGIEGPSKFHKHTQLNPANPWLVQHNFGFEPGGIDAFEDVNGLFVPVKGRVEHLNLNSFLITYDIPIPGYANVS